MDKNSKINPKSIPWWKDLFVIFVSIGISLSTPIIAQACWEGCQYEFLLTGFSLVLFPSLDSLLALIAPITLIQLVGKALLFFIVFRYLAKNFISFRKKLITLIGLICTYIFLPTSLYLFPIFYEVITEQRLTINILKAYENITDGTTKTVAYKILEDYGIPIAYNNDFLDSQKHANASWFVAQEKNPYQVCFTDCFFVKNKKNTLGYPDDQIIYGFFDDYYHDHLRSEFLEIGYCFNDEILIARYGDGNLRTRFGYVDREEQLAALPVCQGVFDKTCRLMNTGTQVDRYKEYTKCLSQ